VLCKLSGSRLHAESGTGDSESNCFSELVIFVCSFIEREHRGQKLVA
jgi:hypothetical protein